MRILMVLATVAVVGCASQAPFRPAETRVEGAADAQLYKSAIRAVSDAGLGVATNDVNAGVIATEWDERGVMGNDKVRYRYRVTIGDGRVRVFSDCQNWTDVGAVFGGQKWNTCSAQENERQAGADSLAREIAANARSYRAEPAPAAPSTPASTAPQPIAAEASPE